MIVYLAGGLPTAWRAVGSIAQACARHRSADDRRCRRRGRGRRGRGRRAVGERGADAIQHPDHARGTPVRPGAARPGRLFLRQPSNLRGRSTLHPVVGRRRHGEPLTVPYQDWKDGDALRGGGRTFGVRVVRPGAHRRQSRVASLFAPSEMITRQPHLGKPT